MEKLKYLIGTVAVYIILSTSGCGKDDEVLTAQQEASLVLKGTWGNAQVASAPVLGADGALENLVLTFEVSGNHEPAAFSATGASDIFQTDATSKWLWENSSSTTGVSLLNVSPVQRLTIENMTDKNLTVSFLFDSPIGGRTRGIGEYSISFTKK